MNCKITKDHKFLVLDLEGQNIKVANWLKEYFTKKYSNWFVIAQKNPTAVIEETFVQVYGNEAFIPSGLWVELIKFCEQCKLPLNFTFDFRKVYNNIISKTDFTRYIEKKFSNAKTPDGGKFYPYPHQIETAFKLLNYKNACTEVATSGGKTLIMFMLFSYLKDVLGYKKGFCIFTPNTSLTQQTADKFIDYEKMCGNDLDEEGNPNWTHSCLYTGSKTGKLGNKVDVIFGNYQSLTRRKKAFFKDTKVIFGDEIHHITARSVRTILSKATNSEYVYGVTGTFPSEGFDNFIAQVFIGPVIHRVTSYELINILGKATPIYVFQVELIWQDREIIDYLRGLRDNKTKFDVDEGRIIMDKEMEVVRNHMPRFDKVCELIKKTTKNTLVLFGDVKGGYGKKIAEELKTTTRKSVYYVDGSTPASRRDYYIEQMENDEDENTIIVASIGTFSEGIDISRLWTVFLVESTKSEKIVAQMLGRGMRNFEGKDNVAFFDIRDNINSGTDNKKDCYMMKHASERDKIYRKRRFPMYKMKIMLDNKI